MKISGKGRVTIPPTMRKKHGLVANAEILFVDQPNGVLVTRANQSQGKNVIATLLRGGKIKGRTDDLLRLTRSPR